MFINDFFAKKAKKMDKEISENEEYNALDEHLTKTFPIPGLNEKSFQVLGLFVCVVCGKFFSFAPADL